MGKTRHQEVGEAQGGGICYLDFSLVEGHALDDGEARLLVWLGVFGIGLLQDAFILGPKNCR